jgi:fucose permease
MEVIMKAIIEGDQNGPAVQLEIWQQHATRALFFIAGFGVASWAPLVSFVKAWFGIEEDMLGLLLLCIGMGSAITMPLAGIMVARFVCRRVLCVASIVYALVLFSLSLMTNMAMLVVALLIFGAGMGTIDVAMNIHAVIVEKAAGKRLMSGMHGLWSVGGFVGVGSFSVLMHLGLSPSLTIFCIAVVMLIILVIFAHHLLPYGSDDKVSSAFVFPKGIVAIVGTLCFVSFLAEGAVLDWSGVFLTSLRGFDMSLAGFGYAAFSGAMLIGRLSGDWIVQKFGDEHVVISGGILAASGFLLVMAPQAKLSLVGFFLIGAGAANIVLVFYSLLGHQRVMPISMAVSAVTTMGYMGILIGPAVIGFIAHQTSLLIAFELLAILLLLQAAAQNTFMAPCSEIGACILSLTCTILAIFFRRDANCFCKSF